MEPIIKTEKLTKKYRDVTAVSEVSLKINKGEIYGFLGLNGAGKTTTIRMLLGMIKPTSGKAFINGIEISPAKTDLWNDIGYIVEIPYSYPDLTVRENLEIIRRMRGIKDKGAVDSIMDKLKILQYANRKARHLSLGNAQRLGLAKSLIHQPQILILDEPSGSLDPAGIFEIRKLLSDLAKNHGVTIFISSHILDEISRFVTRIGIIHDGSLIQEINSVELEKLCSKKLLVNTLDNEIAAKVFLEHNIEFNMTPEKILAVNGEVYIKSPEKVSGLLAENKVPLSMLNVVEEDLESYFLRTIGIEKEQL